MTFKEKLIEMDVCKGAIKWVGDRTAKQAWNECERPDWMIWLIKHAKNKNNSDKDLRLFACEIAERAVKKYWTDKEDKRPVDAIKAAKEYENNPKDENRERMIYAGDAAWIAAFDAGIKYGEHSGDRFSAWAAASSANVYSLFSSTAATLAASDAVWYSLLAAANPEDEERKYQSDLIRKTLNMPTL